jgi:hypothetical protein
MQDSEAARIAHELQERAQKEMRDAEDRAVEGFFGGVKKVNGLPRIVKMFFLMFDKDFEHLKVFMTRASKY